MGEPKIRHQGDIHQAEVDQVNEHVSKVTGMPLGFLYQGDGREPSTRSHFMDLSEFTKLQRHHDVARIPKTATCPTCNVLHLDKTPEHRYSISQRMAMSAAWSRELRLKIKQAEEKSTPKVLVDLEFEDWE